jgi:hypothetical protein
MLCVQKAIDNRNKRVRKVIIKSRVIKVNVVLLRWHRDIEFDLGENKDIGYLRFSDIQYRKSLYGLIGGVV